MASTQQNGVFTLTAIVNDGKGEDVTYEGEGNGPVSAFVDALTLAGLHVKVHDYTEHAMTTGEDSKAVAYVECEVGPDDASQVLWGVGVDPSITNASLKAILGAVNRYIRATTTTKVA